MFQSLSLFLQPYKEIVASTAGFVTIAQFLSGAFICKDIYKKGSTNGIPSNPFVGGFVIGLLMLEYAAMLNDSAMLTVNLAAILLNTLYLLFYIFYCDKKIDVFKALGIGAAFTAVLIGYARIENPELIEYRFGLIVTILMLALIGSPLLEVKTVIKNEDASAIPFPMVLSGTVVSFLWFLYGIILLNEFMIFQNVIGFSLCIVQLVLCFMYPGKEIEKKVLKKDK